ncbi:MAG: PAS domain S-box protein [Betaproteobacteria bacterium]|nr:PAS domain S-box protein [Betaproteobacteria bacterium]
MPLPLDVLILEDSAADAELLVRELKATGFAPLKVRHCDSERGFLATLDPPPDLVLADYQLPQFTGLDALRLLRDRAPDVPFILVSGSIDGEIVGLALREGAADFVLKNRLTRLGVAVERALEQKRIRDEQRRNQDEVRRLAAIVESSQDAILSRALDGKIFSWNAGAERLYGYTAAEAIGRDISLIMPPERRHEPTENWRLLSRGEAVPPYETVRMTKDGRRIHVSLSLSPIKDADGNVTGVAGISQDITALKHTEQELRKQVALAQLLESLARVANEAATPEAAMQACLEHTCRHGGWVLAHVGTVTPGQVVGTAQHSVWHTPDPERFAEFIQHSNEVGHTGRRTRFVGKVLREKKPAWIADVSRMPGVSRLSYAAQAGIKAAFAFPVIMRDEAVAYLEFFAENAREPDQLLMEAMTSAASQLARVIERTSAEHARGRLAAIVESSSEAVISRGLDGAILSWNAAAERIFGWSAAEVVGRPITIIAPPERRGQIRARIERIVHGESIEPFETTHLRKDGTRIATAMTLSPVRDGQGRVVYIAETMRDITRQKQLEREAQQKAAITALMESLARAANEAASPEAAMQTCLARICEHGRWIVGHVMHLAPRRDEWIVTHSQWHLHDEQRFSSFVTLSDRVPAGSSPPPSSSTSRAGSPICLPSKGWGVWRTRGTWASGPPSRFRSSCATKWSPASSSSRRRRANPTQRCSRRFRPSLHSSRA